MLQVLCIKIRLRHNWIHLITVPKIIFHKNFRFYRQGHLQCGVWHHFSLNFPNVNSGMFPCAACRKVTKIYCLMKIDKISTNKGRHKWVNCFSIETVHRGNCSVCFQLPRLVRNLPSTECKYLPLKSVHSKTLNQTQLFVVAGVHVYSTYGSLILIRSGSSLFNFY